MAAVVKLVDEGKLSNKLARQVIEGVLAGEGEPEQVMTDRGLALERDDSVIQAAVDKALEAVSPMSWRRSGAARFRPPARSSAR